jgi:hypothetical protein
MVANVKHGVWILLFFGSLPLCAMDNKPLRRSSRLALLQQAQKPQVLQVQKVQKPCIQRVRKQQVQKVQGSGLDDIMLRPIMVAEFKKIIEEQRRYQ